MPTPRFKIEPKHITAARVVAAFWYLNREDQARAIGVSRRTLYNWLQRKRFNNRVRYYGDRLLLNCRFVTRSKKLNPWQVSAVVEFGFDGRRWPKEAVKAFEIATARQAVKGGGPIIPPTRWANKN